MKSRKGMKSRGKENTMAKSYTIKSVTVDVLVHGKPAPMHYDVRGVFIEGKPGTEYTLRIKNNGSSRILAVPTVDGLNVINGKPGTFSDTGYVIDGYSSVDIDGWRVSNDKVRRFYFTAPQDSYAMKRDKGENLGVIGVAVFWERFNAQEMMDRIKELEEKNRQPVHYYRNGWPNHTPFIYTVGGNITNTSYSLSNSSNTSNTLDVKSMRSAINQDIGTGWGQEKQSRVVDTHFDRDTDSMQLFEIRYNTREQLKKAGIATDEDVMQIASSFPAEFCPPPSN